MEIKGKSLRKKDGSKAGLTEIVINKKGRLAQW